MSKGHEITRRALLAGAGASVSVAALSAAAVSAQPIKIPLETLTAAHREAYAALNDACGLLNDAQKRHSAFPVISVPVVVYPDGTPSEQRDIGAYGLDDIRQSIVNRHAELRRIHCGNWSAKMAGNHVNQLLAELDASEERANKGLENAIALMDEREQLAGIPQAQSVVDAAQAVEMNARIDLLLYRPADAPEAQTKADYISGSVPFLESWCGDDDFTDALIARLGEVA